MQNPMRQFVQRWWRQTQRASAGIPAARVPKAPTEPWMGVYERMHIPPTLRYPDTHLAALLRQTADRFADVPAIRYGDMEWSYRELQANVNRLAAGLAQTGVRPGDKVLMTLPNCPEFLECFFAIQQLGAVVVNAGPLFGADDLRKLVELTQPRLLISLDLQAGLLAADEGTNQIPRVCVSLSRYQTMWVRLGYQYKLWQTRQNDEGARCEMLLDQLKERAASRPPTIAPDPQQVAVLQPTGGTTGTLKVAMLSHRNLVCNATQVVTWGRLRHGQESTLAILPMFHAYGLTMTAISPVLCGATILPLTRFKVGQLLETIVQHRPTVLPLVPAIIHAICDELDRTPNAEAVEAMKQCVVLSGAAPLPPHVAQRFEHLTGLIIMQGYGLTEASPVTHSNPLGETRAESIGIPFPDTDCRVVDLQHPTKEARRGEAGELRISGPQIFQGYLGDAEQTAQVLSTDENGRTWLHTGDVVRVDGDGFFYVVDRLKYMINRGGEKVWPARIEKVLRQHDRVLDAAVIGRTDEKMNEQVVAIVAVEDPESETEALTGELQALCREHLGPFEMPEAFEFTESIPRSALGKLLKYQLRKDASPLQADDMLDEEVEEAQEPL